MLNLTPCFKI